MADRPHHIEAVEHALGHRDPRVRELAVLVRHATTELDARLARARVAARGWLRRHPRVLAVVAAIAMLFASGGALSTSGPAVAADSAANTVRAFGGAPSYGPDSGAALNANFVDLVATPTGKGYWVAAGDGGVFAKGDAHFLGSAAGLRLAGPIVGIAANAGGDGYWLAAADGGVFTYGRAGFAGSLGGYRVGSRRLQGPILDIAATPSGHGYWLLGADGGVFTFGDAHFFGSAVQLPHSTPFVAIAGTRSGRGYYLLEQNGGVFAFGDARFLGSPVGDGHVATDISVSPNGGYDVARVDGSVVGYGGAPSLAQPFDPNAARHPVLGVAIRPGGGAWLLRSYVPPPPARVLTDLSQDPFLKCTRAHESDSAGGYRAISPGGTYRGAYQFLPSTWNNVAAAAGRRDLVGVDPAQAAPADQDFLAMWLYRHSGAGPWGGRCAGLP